MPRVMIPQFALRHLTFSAERHRTFYSHRVTQEGREMSATISQFRLRSAEHQVAFLERETGQWVRDHRDSLGCGEWEDGVAVVNGLFTEITFLDNRVQEAYFDGMPYVSELSDKIAELFRRWLALANAAESFATRFEKTEYEAAGLEDLRRGIRDVSACLDPSDEIGGWIERKRDAALEENAAGQAIEHLVD